MKEGERDHSKRKQVMKMDKFARFEQMQKGRIPEAAIKSFNRKPYQIGGSENECS
jgi:hypothetical protein